MKFNKLKKPYRCHPDPRGPGRGEGSRRLNNNEILRPKSGTQNDIKPGLKIKEKQLLSSIAHGLPLSLKPYEELSKKINIGEKVIFNLIKRWLKEGIVRKFGAVPYHTSVGYKCNAMVAWKIQEDKIKQTGRHLSSFHQISHCYQRKSLPEWEYNLYTMIHTKTRKECASLIKHISKIDGVCDHKPLYTLKEFKKAPLML